MKKGTLIITDFEVEVKEIILVLTYHNLGANLLAVQHCECDHFVLKVVVDAVEVDVVVERNADGWIDVCLLVVMV